MTQLDDGGWVYLGYGDGTYQCCVLCENFSFDNRDKSAVNIDTPSDRHFGYTVDIIGRTITLSNIFFLSDTSKNLFFTNMKQLQVNGPFNVRIKKSATEYYEWDGTYITMPCLYIDLKEVQKPYGGDCEYYVISQLKLVQAGDLVDTN